MNFEVDRNPSSWAHIALCADVTWVAEAPDEYILANQRLWAQNCRISQVLQDSAAETQSTRADTQCELSDKRPSTGQSQEGSCAARRSVKDVIPESRLAQFYGNFYYDEAREKSYVSPNERASGRGHSGQGCEKSDLTECWMLPEVEYWFRKLVDDSTERQPRRRRQYRMMSDDDFELRGPTGARAAGEEAALAARVLSVRPLWGAPSKPPRARAPSPPPAPRKMRARRRQPRRLALAPAPPAYCLEVPAQLLCDPACKFQFDPPRPPQLADCQRAMGRLSASVQAAVRASTARCLPYRGTNVSRYAPTGQRPARCPPDRRYGVWWPKDHPSPRLDRKLQLQQAQQTRKPAKTDPEEEKEVDEEGTEQSVVAAVESETEKAEEEVVSPEIPKETAADEQMPSTSAAALETSSMKKRLYSTVLSMSAPAQINLTGVRLAQKLVAPGLLKLNPKIMLPSARLRSPIADNKFEELEKEALEQYKASDESIDTKFRELEKQAVEQYSTSNSNTSCSSGTSGEKTAEDSKTRRQPTKFQRENPVDSVVIYSQNFPDLNAKGQTSTVMSLKNLHAPPRGEKKEQARRPSKLRAVKSESQRTPSDTASDYEARESKGHSKSTRWTLHMVPPKKRHLTLCVSDFSDEELEEAAGAIRDAVPRIKSAGGKAKMSAHGGGDLRPILRKT